MISQQTEYFQGKFVDFTDGKYILLYGYTFEQLEEQIGQLLKLKKTGSLKICKISCLTGEKTFIRTIQILSELYLEEF